MQVWSRKKLNNYNQFIKTKAGSFYANKVEIFLDELNADYSKLIKNLFDERSNVFIDTSKTAAIIRIFIIVPMPGFSFRGIHIDKTTMLVIKVAKPIDQLNCFASPSAKTTHGAFPIVEWISKDDPNPNIVRPKQRREKVLNLGFKSNGLSEDQDTFGIFLIFKNIN